MEKLIRFMSGSKHVKLKEEAIGNEKGLQSWDDIADWYCKQRSTSPSALTETPIVMRMLGDVKGKTVLDAGCGGGYYSFMLGKLSAEVTGVDSSPKMIDAAKSEMQAQAGCGNVTICEPIDINRYLSYLISYRKTQRKPETFISKDLYFSAIVCSNLLNTIDDPIETIRLFADNLTPGGILVMSVPNPITTARDKSGAESRAIKDFTTPRKIESVWEDHENGRKMHVEYWHRPHSYYLNAVTAAGLVITEVAEPLVSTAITPRSEVDRENIARSAGGIPTSLIIRAYRPNIGY